MTDNEIIKALEYCRQQGITSECERCKVKSGCRATLIENAFDLINRQKAEIERLKEDMHACVREVSRSHEIDRIKAIREFAERLKDMASQTFWESEAYVGMEQIDRLVKEMTEESKT